MKFFILLFFICISAINAQEIKMADPISKASLDSALVNYKRKNRETVCQKLSIDVQTILMSFIPQIVLKDRKIRYSWDRQKLPLIYVYQHLITYDSVQFIQSSVFNFLSEANIYAVDSNYTLKSYSFPELINSDLNGYTKLTCFEEFPYNFVFVDHIFKADFVLSTLNTKDSCNLKDLYIWHIPNLVENTIYKVKAIQPWDNDCYKVEITDKCNFNVNLKLDALRSLEKFRNTRYN